LQEFAPATPLSSVQFSQNQNSHPDRSSNSLLKTLVNTKVSNHPTNPLFMRKYRDLYFTTATILNWHPLFASDTNKDIVIDAFRYCVVQKRANVWAFVIMDMHIHMIWHILSPYSLSGVRRDMLKFISQTIKNKMVADGQLEALDVFKVKKSDRYIQIWKRNPLSVEILYDDVLEQKLNYIHTNLFRKGKDDVSYKYSSAGYYASGERNWDFL